MGNLTEGPNIDTYIHPRLGPIQRIQNQNSPQTMKYMVGVETQKLIQEWQRSLKELKTQKCSQFLLLPLNYEFQKIAMCGTGGTVTIQYQDYMFGLQHQIKNRKQIKRPFREEQVWYLLYNLVQVGATMQKANKKIGDIRPQNILVNEDGEIKLICSESWPGNLDNYELIMQQPQAKVFLSPQQCIHRNRKKNLAYPNHLDLNAAQVFSIGLTVLEAASLKSCFQLYIQAPQWRFNQFKLKEFMDILYLRYSKQLIITIQEMLKISPQRRIKCSTIMQILAPFEHSIVNLQPFILDRNRLFDFLNLDRKRSKSGSKSLVLDASTKSSGFKQSANGQGSPRQSHHNYYINEHQQIPQKVFLSNIQFRNQQQLPYYYPNNQIKTYHQQNFQSYFPYMMNQIPSKDNQVMYQEYRQNLNHFPRFQPR